MLSSIQLKDCERVTYKQSIFSNFDKYIELLIIFPVRILDFLRAMPVRPWGKIHPANKQQNLDVNNFCIMLSSTPLSMHTETPGLHTWALWKIRPQLALVESFPLLILVIKI